VRSYGSVNSAQYRSPRSIFHNFLLYLTLQIYLSSLQISSLMVSKILFPQSTNIALVSKAGWNCRIRNENPNKLGTRNMYTEQRRVGWIYLSHWQGLWVTCKSSWALLSVQVNSCESFWLSKMYFWPPEGLSFRLEVGWPPKHVSNKALPNLEGQLKLHKASIWWQALWKYYLNK